MADGKKSVDVKARKDSASDPAIKPKPTGLAPLKNILEEAADRQAKAPEENPKPVAAKPESAAVQVRLATYDPRDTYNVDLAQEPANAGLGEVPKAIQGAKAGPVSSSDDGFIWKAALAILLVALALSLGWYEISQPNAPVSTVGSSQALPLPVQSLSGTESATLIYQPASAVANNSGHSAAPTQVTGVVSMTEPYGSLSRVITCIRECTLDEATSALSGCQLLSCTYSIQAS